MAADNDGNTSASHSHSGADKAGDLWDSKQVSAFCDVFLNYA